MKRKVWMGITLACSLLAFGGALALTTNVPGAYMAQTEPPDPLSSPVQTADIEPPDPLMYHVTIPVVDDLIG